MGADLPRTFAWGIFNQKLRWSLSLRGWLLLLCLVGGVTALFLWRIHPFLAVTKTVPTEILIVEGWIPDYSITAIAAEFKAAGYKRIYTTGGPAAWKYAAQFGGSYAGYAAVRLVHAGLETNSVVPIPSGGTREDRTFQAALAARDFFATNKIDVSSFNVVTVGPHARRTQYLYRRAFDNKVSVGVIAMPRDDYDADRWWRSSAGVREAISEAAAYVFARFIH